MSGDFNTSVLAEHAWTQHHPVDWSGVTVLSVALDLQARLALEFGIDPHPYHHRRAEPRLGFSVARI